MNYSFGFVDLFGALLAAVLAIVIIIHNPRERLTQYFFGYAVMIGFFNLFNALMIMTDSVNLAFHFERLTIVFWSLFLLFFTKFCFVISKFDREKAARPIFFGLIVVSALVNYVNYVTDWIYKTPVMTGLGYSDVIGRWYLVFVVYSVLAVILSIYLLMRTWRSTKSNREKMQSLVILTALFIGFVAGGVLDGVLPLLGIFAQSTSPIISTLYVMVFAYALTRYGLLKVTPALIAQDVFRMMPVMMDFVDLDRKVLVINELFAKNLGYKSSELIGQDCKLFHANPELHEKFHQELLLKGSIRQGETALLRKDRAIIPVNVDAARVKDRFGETIGEIFIYRDIIKEKELLEKQKEIIVELTKNKERMLSILEDTTEARDEAKKKSEELVKAVDDLKEVDRMKNRFLSVMSHELRTPLTPIKGFSSMLINGQLGPLTEPQINALGSIQRESDHLLALIDSILDTTKLETGREIELNTEPVSVKILIEELVPIIKPQCDQKEQSLEVKVSADLNTIIGDRTKLHRLLTNVIGNAINFTPNGGKISIVGQNVDNGIEIKVIDNGIGIEEQYLEKIFEKFVQIDNSYSRATGGVGLGLAISQAIVEAHGGKIKAESKGIGWGTTIAIDLPVGGSK